MATKPIELTSDASGRTYTWNRSEPPTDSDIAELMAADRAFLEERAQGQKLVMDCDHLGIKRFFRLDAATYEDGALPGRTKELLGLVASAVLRCDDCVDYHLEQAVKAGWSRAEIHDALNVSLVVGGSIVIPHLRRAFASLEELLAERDGGSLPA